MRVITEAKVVDGAYVLAPTDDWAGATLRAGDVISPGSSIGGWAVVAVSAHGARVRRITAREKGEIRAGARPPGEGPTEWLPTGAVRWALSAGAARRGLAHRHRVPADPIERWLRVTGATWAILREARWRCSGPPERVWIWPGGDAAALAALGA